MTDISDQRNSWPSCNLKPQGGGSSKLLAEDEVYFTLKFDQISKYLLGKQAMEGRLETK
jgi:hypothetical protein